MDNMFSSIRLEKKIPIPLYYQLKRQILALIENSVIHSGDPLPPENEWCEMLGISRPTVRQALSELVNEGYLNRYKAKGTFVSKPKVDDLFFNKLESFNKEMIAKGLLPETEVKELKKIPGPHEANERLWLSLDAPLIFLSRLRSVDKVPLVYIETFLPYEPYKKLMDIDFKVNSLYESLETLCNVRVNRAQREIEAVNAGQKEAELLQIAKNKALSLVKTVAFAKNSANPVEFSIAHYRGDMNKFRVDIFR
jgi:GntR family transcriptional regulator